LPQEPSNDRRQKVPAADKSVDKIAPTKHSAGSFFMAMLLSQFGRTGLVESMAEVLQFSTEASRPVRSTRNMTTQLLQEAAQVIPNQQLLINVVSKRVRQLGLGHRPMVETGPRSTLTDIALREIIAGKLTFESVEAADGTPAEK
jgi:DNA-directed RNA polymerase subunit omega